MVSDNEILEKVYTARNYEELMEAYKDWAGQYDEDLINQFGYVAHLATGAALKKVVDDSKARILDAGCGTGLVGEVLHGLGFSRIDALDYSEDMLREAEQKQVYQNYIQADMGKPLEIGDNAYDAITCTGTFSYGHVKPNAFDELIRITRPEGHICFTIREGAYEDYGYRPRMVELEADRRWELLTMTDEDYLQNEGVGCKLCTYKVLNA